eukprot:CAMPEP_0168339282 /NCGR_PEP_ID=MMETSP0213-20121227/13365_1 /TAXON_ID=151035 /ORGANISM="Euplotes harpa, Strain FSP1.4" /LENGTH=114 /DNA_ID=CAMNT_0008345277 /DNA_START=89 /DNA_END=430 /DNA_ORIENTATION=+
MILDLDTQNLLFFALLFIGSKLVADGLSEEPNEETLMFACSLTDLDDSRDESKISAFFQLSLLLFFFVKIGGNNGVEFELRDSDRILSRVLDKLTFGSKVVEFDEGISGIFTLW